ncbi:pseudouridylate synthase 1 homolog [Mercenaria mercenaria]|uniref:pseudouridylate synthase 1 homolog n=1 Tax=Mercenaria mercenaria TaxID=6596 RepID=UPI00234F74DB|nr:pseudouridylate synthase 1 homolog [Mercenaria mercenaria]
MLRRAFVRLKQLVKYNMASALEAKAGEKRAADEDASDVCKKQKGEQKPLADRKRKVALLIAYNGKGYYGLQLNPGLPSVEGEIIKALLEVGIIPQDHHDCPRKMSFQRAARTDKGVSAAGNILSLKMLLNVDNLLDEINKHLPAQIRVFECVRTTNGFNSKNHCSGRTYIYLLPTYAFAPVEEVCTLEYRTNLDIIERVNEVLEKFVGTHNFHNFTSGIKPEERCAQRYILEFECRMPFVRDGVEYCVLSVRGQSFMMHQIRKMVGLTIAVVKGFANIEAIDEAWKPEKMDIPKAPGLGLMLDKLHYDQYNKRWASDGSHDRIDFAHLKEKLDKFKEEYIFSEIMKEEKETQSMMQWLSKLHYHTCSPIENKWSERKCLEAKIGTGSQGSSDSEDLNEPHAENIDSGGTENTNKDEIIETESQTPAVTENKSGTSTETILSNQNESCDEMTSSKLDCDSVDAEQKSAISEKDDSQSSEETKVATESLK